MQKKIFSLLVLLMTAVTGAWADTTVTWTTAEMNSNFYAQDDYESNNSHYGITVTASSSSGPGSGGWYSNGIGVNAEYTFTFTSTVGNIKSIVITADNINIEPWAAPSGWTINNPWDNPRTLSWNGTASTTVNLTLSEGQNISGISTIVFTLSDPDYYLVGNMTSWGIDPQYKLALNESAGDANEYQIAVALPAATELKVVSSTDGSTIKAWFPAEAGNYTVTADGLYTIYFRPGYNGPGDWHASCIYVADGVSFTADGTAWTLAQMPACDLELEVEYYPLATLATLPAAAEGLNDATTADLLTPGTSTDGTLYYALGTSEAPTGQWSQTIPTTEGLEAGEYYVWYKVVGDAQHSDSEPQCIAVTIAAIPAFAVTIDDAGKDASNWQATPAEQRAGQTVTLSYNGKKKVRSITIEKAPAAGLTSYTLAESTAGMIVGTNGLAYAVEDKDNLPDGVTVAGIVAYKDGSKGLVMALTDEASMMDWATACGESGAAAHTPVVDGQTWKLPSQDELTLVKNANSGSSLNSAITNAGGTAIPTVRFDPQTETMTGRYWLSTQGAIDESARTWGINAYDEIVNDSQSYKTDNILVRAIIVF